MQAIDEKETEVHAKQTSSEHNSKDERKSCDSKLVHDLLVAYKLESRNEGEWQQHRLGDIDDGVEGH